MADAQEEWENEPEWIGVDLDGTLAEWTEWKGIDHVGKPLWPMVKRIKEWLRQGKFVKILTARANTPEAIPPIKKWLVEEAGLPELEITNVKGHKMKELWDDRAVQMHPNTGEPVLSDSMLKLLDQDLPSHLSSKEEGDEDFTLFRQLNDPEET